ncbi:GH3 auxin-responsive promoter family protein [Pedobacter arcticus]|uniref:GH3 auxin-responsive promoter family protein n=1 Tax=Pedobacter arcticus TaxID=752140 RepID=UPI000474F0BB|nr:GH3 auxin-responsive promoter family protein [Pedobacter arcticus]
MTIVNSFLNWYMKKRMHQIELFMKYPNEVQEEWFGWLVNDAVGTQWGKKYDYRSIENINQFKERIPVQNYDTLKPYIEKMLNGEQNVLWPSEIKWFAKSSGTTSDRSKFIPVSEESLEDCHFRGGKDMLAIYCNNRPDAKMFRGKSLVLGGSHQINQLSPDSYYGDLSAVIIKNLPFWAEMLRTPGMEIALMDNYEEKIEKMAHATLGENVTNIAGVPTWTIVLAKRILEITGKSNLMEVWPNLELYVHGAVNFEPYREQFKRLIDNPNMYYLETYNASEGFFGIQDQSDSSDLLLMLDYGIFYEFIPMEEVDKEFPDTVSLSEVELGKNYAMVISTNAGLWRYMIGDTVTFTTKNPYRLKITGRTKHFINAFGEEVIIDNAEKALNKACADTDAQIKDYTACPIYFSDDELGAHEWIIEFEKKPKEFERFIDILDNTLREVNSDYDAKRFKDMALRRPKVHMAPNNLFYNWLKAKGKLGGQHKVPRLANERKYVDELLEMMPK